MVEMRAMAKMVPRVGRITRQDVILGYSGKKRKRYERAECRLEFGVKPSGLLKMFVKDERVEFKGGKVNPECRAIQFRDYEYGLELATYVKPYESVFYTIRGGRFPKTRFITKGMQPCEKAKLVLDKLRTLGPGVRILALDAERFDAHYNVMLLKAEHFLLQQNFRGDSYLKRLQKKQIKNKGRYYGSDGSYVKYSVLGGRSSGEMTTALGNNASMACMLNSFGQHFFGPGKYDFVLDGDDSLFFHVGEAVEIDGITEFFREFGMTMKVDAYTTDIYEVDYCQSKIVDVEGFPTFVRNFETVLSKSMCSPKFSDIKGRPKLLKTIALGELSQCYGLPILDPFFRALIRVAEKYMSQRGLKDGGVIHNFDFPYRLEGSLPMGWKTLRSSSIYESTRRSFAKTFKISVESQLKLEAEIAVYDFDLLQKGSGGLPVDVNKWLFDWLELDKPI